MILTANVTPECTLPFGVECSSRSKLLHALHQVKYQVNLGLSGEAGIHTVDWADKVLAHCFPLCSFRRRVVHAIADLEHLECKQGHNVQIVLCIVVKSLYYKLYNNNNIPLIGTTIRQPLLQSGKGWWWIGPSVPRPWNLSQQKNCSTWWCFRILWPWSLSNWMLSFELGPRPCA